MVKLSCVHLISHSVNCPYWFLSHEEDTRDFWVESYCRPNAIVEMEIITIIMGGRKRVEDTASCQNRGRMGIYPLKKYQHKDGYYCLRCLLDFLSLRHFFSTGDAVSIHHVLCAAKAIMHLLPIWREVRGGGFRRSPFLRISSWLSATHLVS